MASISVVVGPNQTLVYNDQQPNTITLDTTAANLQVTYEILGQATAKVKQFAAANNVTLTDSAAAATTTSAG